MKNKALASILLIIVIEVLGFGLILPLQSYYARTSGALTLVGLFICVWISIFHHPFSRESVPAR